MNKAPDQHDEETSIADDVLRNGYDRWHRLEEEKKAIGDDLKELFAELKGLGFAPKALRESFRRFRNIDDADQREHDAVVELYLASLAGARPAHTHENQPDEDGVFEHITEPGNSAGQAAVAPVAVASHSAPEADGEAVDAAAAPTGEVVPPISPETIQAEEANDDGAIGAEVMTSNPGGDDVTGAEKVGAPISPSGDAAEGTGGDVRSSLVPAHNPDTHFLNSKGLLRLHGCLNAEACASARPRQALCFTCSTQHDGPAYKPADVEEGRVIN